MGDVREIPRKSRGALSLTLEKQTALSWRRSSGSASELRPSQFHNGKGRGRGEPRLRPQPQPLLDFSPVRPRAEKPVMLHPDF